MNLLKLWRTLFGKTEEMREVEAKAEAAFERRQEAHSMVMQLTEQIASDEIRMTQDQVREIMGTAEREREGNGETAVPNGT